MLSLLHGVFRFLCTKLRVITFDNAKITNEVIDYYQSLTIPPVLKPDDIIDDYKIIKRLAKDARSHIYLALNQQDNIKYIIKAPSPDYHDDTNYMQDFAFEQWLACRLNNTHLMKGFERPNDSKYFYNVFEYIPGLTLKQWMQRKGVISLNEAQAILSAMIKPVQVLHKNNIVHRDLKPENFIFDNNGTLKLIDYGTIELGSLKDSITVPTQQNPSGDIRYLAPEYLVKGYGTASSDLFSLAAITYELLTGELPYSAIISNQQMPKSYNEWRYRGIFTNKHFSSYLPYWVDNVLRKALSPTQQDRYQSLSEFEYQLKNPDQESLKLDNKLPLLERNPVLFYQVLSLVLFLLLIAKILYD